jgi:hypothetical protein
MSCDYDFFIRWLNTASITGSAEAWLISLTQQLRTHLPVGKEIVSTCLRGQSYSHIFPGQYILTHARELLMCGVAEFPVTDTERFLSSHRSMVSTSEPTLKIPSI